MYYYGWNTFSTHLEVVMQLKIRSGRHQWTGTYQLPSHVGTLKAGETFTALVRLENHKHGDEPVERTLLIEVPYDKEDNCVRAVIV